MSLAVIKEATNCQAWNICLVGTWLRAKSTAHAKQSVFLDPPHQTCQFIKDSDLCLPWCSNCPTYGGIMWEHRLSFLRNTFRPCIIQGVMKVRLVCSETAVLLEKRRERQRKPSVLLWITTEEPFKNCLLSHANPTKITPYTYKL